MNCTGCSGILYLRDLAYNKGNIKPDSLNNKIIPYKELYFPLDQKHFIATEVNYTEENALIKTQICISSFYSSVK